MAEVRLDKITQNRGDEIALNDVSLKIDDGEILTLLGPPGGGKTSLLRLIAGLDNFDSGEIFIAGQDVSKAKPAARNVAFVPRLDACHPFLTVYETLAFPLRLPARKIGEADIRSQVEEISIALKINRLLPTKVGTLSAADQMRVALGRAFVRNASLYLFDNPLAFLGAQVSTTLCEDLKSLLIKTNATAIFATQDQGEAMSIGDRIAILEHGRIVQIGKPREIYDAPANVHVASQLGSPAICFLPKGLLPTPHAPSATKTIGARPENMQIAKAVGRRKHQGVVERVEPYGSYELLHIQLLDGPKITTLKPDDETLVPDDHVSIALHDPIWFDAAGNRIAATV